MKNWTLQKKWTYSSAISIFLSFLTMCIILYFSLYNWMLLSEKQTAQNTLNEVVNFFESKGPVISIQDIQRNRILLNQLVNQEQSVRILNKDGIEVLRINDASPFPIFSKDISADFKRVKIKEELLFYKTAEIDFGLFTGYVEISHSLDSFAHLMRYIFIAMIIFAFITLALSALIGYFLSSILLKPLKELRDEMQKAKKTKFTQQVNFQYSTNDEIGELLTIYKQLMYEVSETIMRQDNFIQNVSHELRTPIQVVEGHLSLLDRWGKDDKVVLEESLEIALIEIQKMKKMIEDMLNIARKEIANEVVITNVEAVLISLKKKYLLLEPKAIIDVQTNGNEVVGIPPTVLEQIIRNLIENAIRHNDNDPYIKVSTRSNERSIIFTVEDNGVGIPLHEIPKIFDRFYTVDASRIKSKGGYGLGLSIVNMLVLEYKGSIYVNSKEQEGTKFDIIFPKITKD